jgi:hypothetical protein
MRENNTFYNNIAENSGGAVKWDDVEPRNIGNQIFKNNYAALYGNDIGSFP